EDGIRDRNVTGVQTCALPIYLYNFAGSDVYLSWALIGTVTAVIMCWINVRGIRTASFVQTFVVSFLLVVAVLLIVGVFVGSEPRSEERRVGKEWRTRGRREGW